MEYNSSRVRLLMPEYGRNIQKMVQYAMGVQDREERSKLARSIVNVMGQLNPQLRELTDFKHKLWDHLFYISDFKLDVDSPYPMPDPSTYKLKPRKVSYPGQEMRFRHYGRIVEESIKDIAGMEDGPTKDQRVLNLANFMKMLYVNWNKDTVTDEVIFDNIRTLSGGRLVVKEDARLQHASELPSIKQVNHKKQGKRSRNKNNGKNYRK
ncbi:MAG: DUF4290 domain-containing protein [Bacteroidota bacterium]|jgi:hypothetical protein